jgi:hypothetical protein
LPAYQVRFVVAGRFNPLLPEKVCVHLGKLTSAEDVDDYEVLRVVAVGKGQQSRVDGMDVRGGSAGESADVEPLVQAVFAEISADNLAQRIDQPIDAARASYLLDRVTFDSDDEVVDCVASFYYSGTDHLNTSCYYWLAA